MHDDDHFDERVARRTKGPLRSCSTREAVDPVIDFLVEIARGGGALQLGIGTSWVALPLAQRGVPVYGFDLSKAMVARLQAKPGRRRHRRDDR